MSTVTEQSSAALAPTIADVRLGLSNGLADGFDACWSASCSAAGISVSSVEIDDDDFDRLLGAIADQGPLCRVMSMSWRIRRTAAHKLSELGR